MDKVRAAFVGDQPLARGRCACRGDRFPDRTHDGAPGPGQAGGDGAHSLIRVLE